MNISKTKAAEKKREYRRKVAENAVRHDEIKEKDRARYKQRKEQGGVKFIKDLSREEQITQRAKWAEKKRKQRKSKRDAAKSHEGENSRELATNNESAEVSIVSAAASEDHQTPQQVNTEASEEAISFKCSDGSLVISPNFLALPETGIIDIGDSCILMEVPSELCLINQNTITNVSGIDTTEQIYSIQQDILAAEDPFLPSNVQSDLDSSFRHSSREPKRKLHDDFLYEKEFRPKKMSKEDASTETGEAPTASSSNTSKLSRQQIIGRKIRRNNDSKLKKELNYRKQVQEELEAKVTAANKRAEMFKKRYLRLESKLKGQEKNIAVEQVEKLIGKRDIPQDIKDKLIENEAIILDVQSAHSSIRDQSLNSHLTDKFQCNNLRSLKLLTKCGGKVPYKKKIKRNSRNSRADPQLTRKIVREKVKSFWIKDKVSRECPDKRRCYTDPVTKEKIQLRFMNGTAKTLFKEFKTDVDTSSIKISFSNFCRFRPKFVVKSKLTDRDTCLCVHCENIQLKVQKLNTLKVLNTKCNKELAYSLCCSDANVDCLLRNCKNCEDKRIIEKPFEDMETTYKVWEKISESRISAKTKKEIEVQRTVLSTKKSRVSCLLQSLKEEMKAYMEHIGRASHQQKKIEELIKDLAPDELALRVDFSENYACKYAHGEAHAVHFGASRDQICLHTGVAYWQGGLQSFTSCSPCLRHDAYAAMAHIKPVLSTLLQQHPETRKLHMITDSPTAQYRNQTMFGIIKSYLPKQFPQLTEINWHYTEAGHGKSSADGIGGALKRRADQLVADGTDINNFESFITALRNSDTTVMLQTITEQNIVEVEQACKDKVAFQGTMKTHQVTWARTNLDVLQFNMLTCLSCSSGEQCKHYSIGSAPMLKRKNPGTPKKKADASGEKKNRTTAKIKPGASGGRKSQRIRK